MTAGARIAAGAIVVARLRLFDARGELVEPQETIRYRHGHEEILPGLERGLEGARAGDELRLTLEPGEAFGDYDPEGIVAIPRSELPAGLRVEPGAWITARLMDDDGGEEGEDGNEGDAEEVGDEGGDDEREMELRVLEVHPEQILVDANHPLAGQRIVFEIEVVSVEPH